MVAIFDTFPFSPFSHLKMRTNWTAFKKSCHFQFDTIIILYSVAFVYLRSEIKKKFIGLRLWLTSLLKNTGQPETRDIFMKNGNESRDVLGDSRKCFRGPWAEIGKYWPGKEPIRLQDFFTVTVSSEKKKTKKTRNITTQLMISIARACVKILLCTCMTRQQTNTSWFEDF